MGSRSNSCLLVTVGLGKVTGEGTFTEETGDGEAVLDEMNTGDAAIDAAAAGRGEEVFEAETDGVKLGVGGVMETFES